MMLLPLVACLASTANALAPLVATELAVHETNIRRLRKRCADVLPATLESAASGRDGFFSGREPAAADDTFPEARDAGTNPMEPRGPGAPDGREDPRGVATAAVRGAGGAAAQGEAAALTALVLDGLGGNRRARRGRAP